MSQYTYFKLSETPFFTVNKDFGYKWCKWIESENRMEKRDDYFEGSSKRYSLGVSVDETQGYLELSQSQYGQMLVDVVRDGVADIRGLTFRVKTVSRPDGKNNYYINFHSAMHKNTSPQAQNSPSQPSNVQNGINTPLDPQKPLESQNEALEIITPEDIPFN